MPYKILARYPNSDKKDFGEWQVGTFTCKKDAESYIERTVERYSKFETKYHLDMKLEKISVENSDKFNTLLNNLID